MRMLPATLHGCVATSDIIIEDVWQIFVGDTVHEEHEMITGMSEMLPYCVTV